MSATLAAVFVLWGIVSLVIGLRRHAWSLVAMGVLFLVNACMWVVARRERARRGSATQSRRR